MFCVYCVAGMGEIGTQYTDKGESVYPVDKEKYILIVWSIGNF